MKGTTNTAMASKTCETIKHYFVMHVHMSTVLVMIISWYRRFFEFFLGIENRFLSNLCMEDSIRVLPVVFGDLLAMLATLAFTCICCCKFNVIFSKIFLVLT